jgi:hypothetical protein
LKRYSSVSSASGIGANISSKVRHESGRRADAGEGVAAPAPGKSTSIWCSRGSLPHWEAGRCDV